MPYGYEIEQGLTNRPGFISKVVDDNLAELRKTPQRVVGILSYMRGQLETIAANEDFNENAKLRLEAAARKAAVEDLNALVDKTRSRKEDIESHLVFPDNRSDTQRVADELAETRAWNRAVRLLDSGKGPLEVIEAVATDRAAVRALRAELPAYLQSAGYSGKDLRRALEHVGDALDCAETPHLSDAERRALEIRRGVDAGLYRLQIAEGFARQEISGGSPATVIPDWAETKGDPKILRVED